MKGIEVRVGSDNPNNRSPGLLNKYCGYITAPFDLNDKNNSVSNVTVNDTTILNVVMNCSDVSMAGQFITIQKLQNGQLEIYEVLFYPHPGKSVSGNCRF